MSNNHNNFRNNDSRFRDSNRFRTPVAGNISEPVGNEKMPEVKEPIIPAVETVSEQFTTPSETFNDVSSNSSETEKVSVVKSDSVRYGVVAHCKRLNLRSSTNKEERNVISELDPGTKVIILEAVEDIWYAIRVVSSPLTGYVMSQFIERDEK